jgi:Sigma-70 region 2
MAADRSTAELERFLAERADHLLRTAVLLAGNREAGEDLLQTAVERLLRRWGRLDGDPEGYVRRTLGNLAIDGYRRAGRWRQKERLLRTERGPAARGHGAVHRRSPGAGRTDLPNRAAAPAPAGDAVLGGRSGGGADRGRRGPGGCRCAQPAAHRDRADRGRRQAREQRADRGRSRRHRADVGHDQQRLAVRRHDHDDHRGGMVLRRPVALGHVLVAPGTRSTTRATPPRLARLPTPSSTNRRGPGQSDRAGPLRRCHTVFHLAYCARLPAGDRGLPVALQVRAAGHGPACQFAAVDRGEVPADRGLLRNADRGRPADRRRGRGDQADEPCGQPDLRDHLGQPEHVPAGARGCPLGVRCGSRPADGGHHLAPADRAEPGQAHRALSRPGSARSRSPRSPRRPSSRSRQRCCLGPRRSA